MGFLDEYEPVEDRIRAFWSDHADGRITTELLSEKGGEFIVKASIWRGSPHAAVSMPQLPPDATGLAHEDKMALPTNMKASALEVCETSAIGRALANLGYAPKGKRPSREEMRKAELRGGDRPERGPGSVPAPNQAPPTVSGTMPEATRPGDGGSSGRSRGALIAAALKAHSLADPIALRKLAAARHPEWNVRSMADLNEARLETLAKEGNE